MAHAGTCTRLHYVSKIDITVDPSVYLDHLSSLINQKYLKCTITVIHFQKLLLALPKNPACEEVAPVTWNPEAPCPGGAAWRPPRHLRL